MPYAISKDAPAKCGEIVLDRGLHGFEFIEISEHIQHLAKCQEVSLGNEIVPLFRMAQYLHLVAETADCTIL